MIQGGMGIAAGGNINPDGVSMFEPIGGTAPEPHRQGHDQPAGRDRRACRCCCAQLGEAEAADARRRGDPVRAARSCSRCAPGEMGYSTLGGRRPRRRGGDVVSDAPLQVELYDTTLRDGAQRAGLSLLDRGSAADPAQARPGRLPVRRGRLAGREPARHRVLPAGDEGDAQARHAHGVRHDAQGGGAAPDDVAVLRDLLDAGTEVVCLVGKAWDLHVTEALRTDLDEGVAMVRDSVAFLRAQGRRVFFDAEHFFDGYRSDPAFALRVLAAAEEAGRRAAGPVRHERRDAPVRRRADRGRGAAQVDGVPLGIHVHNDAGCAVANSLIAVEPARLQVQGVVNGYGERTGNADLIPIAANLVLKMGARMPARRRRSSTSPSSRTTSPRSRTSRPTRASRTRDGTRSRTRPGCTRAGSPGSRAPTSTSSPRRWATAGASSRRDLGGGGHDPDEGGRVRRRDRRRRDPGARRRAQGARGARLHVRGRGRLARAPDAAGRRMVPAVLRDRELPRPRRGAGRRRRAAARRGDRQGRDEGHAAHRVAPRGRARSARSTTRSARR